MGVTIHYTADRKLGSSITALKARSLGYHLIVDRDGGVFQLAPLTEAVWHAGRALWQGLSPNRTHIAISLLSWGKLDKLAKGAFQTWTGRTVPTSEVAERQGGAWDKATPEQEASLMAILGWLVTQGIDPRHVCGHHECCLPEGRKVDPGGVLCRTMPEIREVLNAGRRGLSAV